MTATEIQWTKPQLLEALSELDWTQPAAMKSDAWSAYFQHYDLGFSEYQAQHSAGYIDTQGFKIVVQRWQQNDAKGTALIMHGYYDHVGLYDHLIRFCLSQGWNVVMYDLPGHGLSSGEPAVIDSFQQYDAVFERVVDDIRQHEALPLRVFGQSTGGAIIINYLLTRGIQQANSPFADVLLLAPLIRPRQWPKAKFLHSVLKFFIKQVKRHFNDNSPDADFLTFIAQHDPLQPKHLSVRWVGALKQWVPMIESQSPTDMPIGVIQGDHDQTVEWQHNLSVLTRVFPQHRLLMMAGGQHHLVNESPSNRDRMFQQVMEWVKSPSV